MSPREAPVSMPFDASGAADFSATRLGPLASAPIGQQDERDEQRSDTAGSPDLCRSNNRRQHPRSSSSECWSRHKDDAPERAKLEPANPALKQAEGR